MSLLLKAAFILFFAPSVFADRCDGMAQESCNRNSAWLPDTTGLLGSNASRTDQMALYQETMGNFRAELVKIVDSDPALKEKFDEGGFSRFLRCITLQCDPQVSKDKFNIALWYLTERYEYLNPVSSRVYGDGIGYRNRFAPEVRVSFEGFQVLDDPRIQALIQKTDDSIYAKAAPQYQRDYIKKTLFPKIKDSMKNVLQSLPEGPDKERILAKIDQVEVEAEDCDIGILVPNAYYDQSRVKYCYSLMYANSNLYTEIFTLAHELAHSIDPCTEPSMTGAFGLLTACLRKRSSVEARVDGYAVTSVTCQNKGGQVDQIQEAFADWFAAEVLSDVSGKLTLAMKRSDGTVFGNGISNVFRPLCNGRTDFTTHPHDEDRIGLIVTQPNIRKRMGCAEVSPKTYCTFISPQENPKEATSDAK
jgi:hypothetical protein